MAEPSAPSPIPRVSVIVPVRDRRVLLGKLLDCLAAQTVTDHEVIVVDDGSTDGSKQEVESRVRTGQPVVVLEGAGRGAVAARCAGVSVARADVLAFTDSDCEPAPDWLERGLAAIDAGADVVQGRTEPAAEVRPLERTVWVTREDGLYATCNVFYRRSAFEHAGGFDRGAAARLGFRPGRVLRDLGMGEDTLLGWRVRREGRSAFVPEAVVRHHVFPRDVRNHVRRALSAGGFPMLVREVPELRRTFLHRRVVLGAPTRLPLYAAVVFVALRQRRAAFACLTAWVAANWWVVRRAEGTTPIKAASLPAVLAGDAVTAASLLVGSTRARTLVL
jgi:glycosyltransferase involved in cell wall biosynthesis